MMDEKDKKIEYQNKELIEIYERLEDTFKKLNK